MGFSDERGKCYEWFNESLRDKIGVKAMEEAFREVALMTWLECAKQSKESPSDKPSNPKWLSFESVVESLNQSLQSRLQRDMTDDEQNIVFSAYLDIGIKLGHIGRG
jgi:hypothetical protein